MGELRLGGPGEDAGPPLALFPSWLATNWARPNEHPSELRFPHPDPTRHPGPRRLRDTPRTLTICPHGQARQTEQEQRRGPEPGAGAGSLGSHGPGVHGLAGSSEGSGCDPGCLGHCPACATRLCALRSARALPASLPARRRGRSADSPGGWGRRGRRGLWSRSAGAPSSRGSCPWRRGGGCSPAPPSCWAPGSLGAKRGCAGQRAPRAPPGRRVRARGGEERGVGCRELSPAWGALDERVTGSERPSSARRTVRKRMPNSVLCLLTFQLASSFGGGPFF